MLPSSKLGLYALTLELSAWSGGALLDSQSDSTLLWYLVLHGGASFLLASAAILVLPPSFARPRRAILLLMTGCSYAVPIFGFLGVLAGIVVLRTHRYRAKPEAFESLQLPQFDPHQRTTGGFRQSGLRSFLGNTQAPMASRMGALVALQYVSGRVASSLLRDVLTDPSEDIRLLAYGMLDNQEKRINQAIDEELRCLTEAIKIEGEAQPGAQTLAAARRLSDLYWELIYQEMVQGDLRTHAVAESSRYCEIVLRHAPEDAAINLRQGRLLHARHELKGAEIAYFRALDLGLPSTRVLPYLAELRFDQGDFAGARHLMSELSHWSSLPRLRPVIEYWKAQ